MNTAEGTHGQDDFCLRVEMPYTRKFDVTNDIGDDLYDAATEAWHDIPGTPAVMSDEALRSFIKQMSAVAILWPDKQHFPFDEDDMGRAVDSSGRAGPNVSYENDRLFCCEWSQASVWAALQERVSTLLVRKSFEPNTVKHTEEARELAAFGRILFPANDLGLSSAQLARGSDLADWKSYASKLVFADSAAQMKLVCPQVVDAIHCEEGWSKAWKTFCHFAPEGSPNNFIHSAANLRLVWPEKWETDCPLTEDTWTSWKANFRSEDLTKTLWNAANMQLLAYSAEEFAAMIEVLRKLSTGEPVTTVQTDTIQIAMKRLMQQQ